MSVRFNVPAGTNPANTSTYNNMKKKHILSSILALGLVAGSLTGCATDKKEGKEGKASAAQLEAQATITKAEAEKIALAKVPGGTVKGGEIEKEDGKLVWSFDITTPVTADITEVIVDALTGAVISVEKETPADQAKEKKEDEQGNKDKDDDKK